MMLEKINIFIKKYSNYKIEILHHEYRCFIYGKLLLENETFIEMLLNLKVAFQLIDCVTGNKLTIRFISSDEMSYNDKEPEFTEYELCRANYFQTAMYLTGFSRKTSNYYYGSLLDIDLMNDRFTKNYLFSPSNEYDSIIILFDYFENKIPFLLGINDVDKMIYVGYDDKLNIKTIYKQHGQLLNHMKVSKLIDISENDKQLLNIQLLMKNI